MRADVPPPRARLHALTRGVRAGRGGAGRRGHASSGGGAHRPGGHRLHRRHDRGPHRRADEQRPWRRPMDPSPQPSRRSPRRRRDHKDLTPMNPSRINRPEARVLAEQEFGRFADLVASLTPDEWATPTDCTGWDVRKMSLHVLGSADAQASIREFTHQLRHGLPLNKKIDSHHWVDGMNELQIRERDHLTNDEIVAQLTAVGANAVKGRWRTPLPMRYA